MTAVAPAAAAAASAGPRAPLLHIDGVRVALGGRDVLAGVTLSLAAGELVGLVGRNGAGKSTLLRAITAVLGIDGGRVAIDGRSLDAIDRTTLAHTVAVVQQLPEAPLSMRVGELVLLGRHPHLGLLGRESPRDRSIAEHAMRRAGCDRFADREIGTLSGGERRRAFIARALAQQPALLLLDEPTANLDANAQGQIFDLLREIAGGGVGVLAVVHDLTLAAAYCNRTAILHDGRIVADGPPREVLTEERVMSIYGDHVEVIHHPRTGAPVILPVTDRPARDSGALNGNVG